MDDDAMAGAMDPVRPWTVKAISVEVRDLAIIAARKEGLSVGQWLERRIREWATGEQVSNRSDRPGLADLAALLHGVAAVAAAPNAPPGLIRDLRGLVREARGLPARSTRALPPPGP